jgi:hypothetical protein
MIAVVLLALQGFAIDRLVGLDYPVWAAPREAPSRAPGEQEEANAR